MSAIIKHTVQNPVAWANATKNSTEGLDKACKVVVNAVKFSSTVAQVSTDSQIWEPIANFSGQLKVFNGLVGSFNWINRLNEWACPTTMTAGKKKISDYRCRFDKKCHGKEMVTNKNGEKVNAQKNVFKDDGYWSLTKTISQIFTTIAHSIEFVRFWEVIGIVSYGAASSILGIVKSFVYIPSATFGIIAGSISLRDSKYHMNNVAAKVNGWSEKLGGKDGDDFKKDKLVAHYNEKLTTRALELKGATDTKKQAALQGKIDKYTQFIQEIGDVTDGDAIGDNTKFHEYCTVKLQGWEKNVDTAKSNRGKANTKTWMGIAVSVGKLAIGIIALVGLFVGVATNPWFVIAISIGWSAIHTLDLSKWLYGTFNKVADIKAPTPIVEFDRV
jgi:hypothetical protein